VPIRALSKLGPEPQASRPDSALSAPNIVGVPTPLVSEKYSRRSAAGLRPALAIATTDSIKAEASPEPDMLWDMIVTESSDNIR
jgi:hypothetical protein